MSSGPIDSRCECPIDATRRVGSDSFAQPLEGAMARARRCARRVLSRAREVQGWRNRARATILAYEFTAPLRLAGSPVRPRSTRGPCGVRGVEARVARRGTGRHRFEQETIWLTQALISELFQVAVPTVNEHLKSVYAENELDQAATIRKSRIVRQEGARQVTRDIEHYSLPAILAVGYRVRSHRGTQFRQWATARLTEYLVKGFAMDDERLKNPPGPG